jgi:hypothetical protein
MERMDRTTDRIEVKFHDYASPRLVRELTAFVRYCIGRIERELGATEHWTATIAPGSGAFVANVTVSDGEFQREVRACGLDGALAAWNALCSLEQALRESRARRDSAIPA